MLCFKENGQDGNKEIEIGLPKEAYLEHMTKELLPPDHYDANVEDEKKERVFFEIGIEVKVEKVVKVRKKRGVDVPTTKLVSLKQVSSEGSNNSLDKTRKMQWTAYVKPVDS
jgi:hypothetical protein